MKLCELTADELKELVENGRAAWTAYADNEDSVTLDNRTVIIGQRAIDELRRRGWGVTVKARTLKFVEPVGKTSGAEQNAGAK
jgi:hypothetical protein